MRLAEFSTRDAIAPALVMAVLTALVIGESVRPGDPPPAMRIVAPELATVREPPRHPRRVVQDDFRPHRHGCALRLRPFELHVRDILRAAQPAIQRCLPAGDQTRAILGFEQKIDRRGWVTVHVAQAPKSAHRCLERVLRTLKFPRHPDFGGPSDESYRALKKNRGCQPRGQIDPFDDRPPCPAIQVLP